MNKEKPKPTLGWLASYLKSGNTYLRILLTNYFSDSQQAASINALMFGERINSRPDFEGFLGVSIDELPLSEIAALRIEFCKSIADAAEYGLPTLIKTHDRFCVDAAKQGVFALGVSYAAVYLVRNPVDVLLSYAHHDNRGVDAVLEHMENPDACLADKRNPAQLPQILSSWSGHVDSWQMQKDCPLLTIRYEDLVASPALYLERVLTLFGFDIDQNKIAQAVEYSTLEKLQKQEIDSGFREKNPCAESFFCRRLKTQQKLKVEQIEKLLSTHAKVMERFDYSTKLSDYLHYC